MHTIIYAALGYLFLILVVRSLSRRPGAQMTPFEFVIIFVVGGVIILATMGEDHSITNSTCAVIAVAIMHRTVSWLKVRFPKFGAVLDGTPLVLLKKGEWESETMKKMHLTDMDVMTAARTKGVKELGGIKYAILERNGGISIIKKQE